MTRALPMLALLVAACSTNGSQTTDRGPVMPTDHPPVGPEIESAGTRRLSIRQYAASMPVALGGSSWLIGTRDGHDVRSAALGEADYLTSVEDNLEPSAMHLKFMGDAARDGCARAVAADAGKPEGQRAIMRKPTVDENLRYLKLRFHGVKVAAGDDAPIAGLRTLYTAAVNGAANGGTPSAENVREGWRAVCVALLMSPEYHLY